MLKFNNKRDVWNNIYTITIYDNKRLAVASLKPNFFGQNDHRFSTMLIMCYVAKNVAI
jgi:hypothetical protein